MNKCDKCYVDNIMCGDGVCDCDGESNFIPISISDDLKKAYEAIVNNCLFNSDDDDEFCQFCDGQTTLHEKDCIVLKSKEWLEENQ